VIEAVTGPELKRSPWRSGWRFLKGYRQAHQLLKEFRPQVVVGCGGYGSLPTGVAAALSRIPLLLMEQNLIAGMATVLLASLANKILIPCEQVSGLTRWREKCLVVGNPVRSQITQLISQTPEEIVQRRGILVLGGSQGSQSLNDVVLKALTSRGVPPGWNVVHLTGEGEQSRVLQEYSRQDVDAQVLPYFGEIQELYSNAGLVIGRAGAMTLSELSCAGIPAIILPLRSSAQDHQSANARWYSQHGAVVTLDDAATDLSSALAQQIHELTESSPKRLELCTRIRQLAVPDSADRVAELLWSFR
jgi:UDP-N-acetylglucosamine--N-acetylmuramyl-(pentapeptide) pyrophosphoryl-undecaprenol N-acetylglucosamine transferase